MEGYPGLYRDLQTYLKERIREVLTGSSEAIIVRIFGSDLEVLRDQAEVVRKALVGIDGIVRPEEGSHGRSAARTGHGEA